MREPIAAYQFNHPKRTDMVSSPKEMSELPAVPPIHQWDTKYSGEDSCSGGYRRDTVIGTYHVNPTKTRDGLCVGYHLMFANTGKGKQIGEGMWTDLGVYSHLGNAVTRAKKHYEAHSKGVSLHESVSPACAKKCALAAKKDKKGSKKKTKKGKKGGKFLPAKEESFSRVASILSRRS